MTPKEMCEYIAEFLNATTPQDPLLTGEKVWEVHGFNGTHYLWCWARIMQGWGFDVNPDNGEFIWTEPEAK